jgi:hypothetical protein
MAFSLPRTNHDDLPARLLRVNEPPPPIAQTARNRGLTPLQTYLRLLEEDRFDLDNEMSQSRVNQ